MMGSLILNTNKMEKYLMSSLINLKGKEFSGANQRKLYLKRWRVLKKSGIKAKREKWMVRASKSHQKRWEESSIVKLRRNTSKKAKNTMRSLIIS